MGTSLILLVPISRDQSITHKVSAMIHLQIPSIPQYSTDDSHLLGIPRSREIITIPYPVSTVYQYLSAMEGPRACSPEHLRASQTCYRSISLSQTYISGHYLSHKSLHQLRTAMHHQPTKSRKSFQSVNPNGVRFSPAGSTPGGALPSISLSFNGIVYGRYLIAFEPLTFTFLANAFALGRPPAVHEFHLSRRDTNAPELSLLTINS
uniref:Reverse transcriptase n=1 Tax=Heterorhabditis bacteriophora TaxID=37862 RepID=A0A1I7WDA7_HETBA